MKSRVAQLGSQLGSDIDYFRSVYNYTFDFAKTETGQRSIGKCTFQVQTHNPPLPDLLLS
jgi:hypothetical protein